MRIDSRRRMNASQAAGPPCQCSSYHCQHVLHFPPCGQVFLGQTLQYPQDLHIQEDHISRQLALDNEKRVQHALGTGTVEAVKKKNGNDNEIEKNKLLADVNGGSREWQESIMVSANQH